MARYGTWRPLGSNFAAQPKLTTPDIISLHTMVGTLAGTDSMFHHNGYAGTFSHFGVGHDGEVLQWQDTAYRGAANYNGNHRIISVESADMGTGFAAWNTSDGNAVPAWTPAQVESLAHLVAAMCRAHGIPCELIPDSRAGRRGVGYHRQGIDGSYPDHRVPDGEVWSTARGKVCPGSRRIAQIPALLERARALLSEDDMPLSPQDLDAIRQLIRQEVAGAVWNAPIPDYYQAPDPTTGQQQSLPAFAALGWGGTHAAHAAEAAGHAADVLDRQAGTGGPDPAVRYRLVAEQ